MIKIVAIVIGVLVVSAVLVILIGYMLPKHHVASRAIIVHRPPGEVFALISDFQHGASWRTDVESVDMLSAAEGQTRFREHVKGAGAITMRVVQSNPPQRLVTQIDDKSLPFGGMWIFEISPVPGGSRLNITERGEIYNPIFRFVSRFFMGYTRTIDTYLQNVARKFGESAAPENGSPAT